jgi:hypothetical protein
VRLQLQKQAEQKQAEEKPKEREKGKMQSTDTASGRNTYRLQSGTPH